MLALSGMGNAERRGQGPRASALLWWRRLGEGKRKRGPTASEGERELKTMGQMCCKQNTRRALVASDTKRNDGKLSGVSEAV